MEQPVKTRIVLTVESDNMVEHVSVKNSLTLDFVENIEEWELANAISSFIRLNQMSVTFKEVSDE